MPRAFLLKKPVKEKRLVNNQEVCKCGKCRCFKHPSEFEYVVSGRVKKSNFCIACRRRKNRNYMRLSEVKIRVRSSILLRRKRKSESIILSINKKTVIRFTELEKVEILGRLINNLKTVIDKNVKIRYNFNHAIGLKNKEHRTLFVFLEKYFDKKINFNSFGTAWYCDYDIKRFNMSKVEDINKCFNYQNIIIKKIDKLF